MSTTFWDERLETLPGERRRVLRDHRLRWQIRRCWDNSPFYRARLEAVGLNPSTYMGLADWHRMPPLRGDALPGSVIGDAGAATWAVAPEAWWRVPATSREQWRRVLTDGDQIQRADLAARALWTAGGRPDVPLRLSSEAQNERLLGAIDDGARRAGVAMSPDAPLAVTWATTWPPHSDQNVRITGALALPFVAPTVAYACGQRDGVHWADDHFLIEIVDPATGDAVASGETGAVLVTDLTREGSPLLRFWTGVEAALDPDMCPCGRTSARSPVVRSLA
jgi:phenylacetate-coenzyme A ligase PaaK-like adenylate-forming protein